MLIVLDGMDCTGKTTLCNMLYSTFSNIIPSLKQKSFPERTGIVAEYLSGSKQITPFMFQSACFIQKFRFQNSAEFKEHNWIIDRWEPSGVVYGFLDSHSSSEEDIVDTFKNNDSYTFTSLKVPDVGCILTVDPFTGEKRNNFRNEPKDVYETNTKQAILFDLFNCYVKNNPAYTYMDTSKVTIEEVYSKLHDMIVNIIKL